METDELLVEDREGRRVKIKGSTLVELNMVRMLTDRKKSNICSGQSTSSHNKTNIYHFSFQLERTFPNLWGRGDRYKRSPPSPSPADEPQQQAEKRHRGTGENITQRQTHPLFLHRLCFFLIYTFATTTGVPADRAEDDDGDMMYEAPDIPQDPEQEQPQQQHVPPPPRHLPEAAAVQQQQAQPPPEFMVIVST